jgi:hypothetical protein
MAFRAFLPILFATTIHGADLKPETVAEWNGYVHSVDQAMQERLRPNHAFLWVDEIPDRASQVRASQILVAPAADHTPRRVASGLIHHWIGAAFIPEASVDDALAVIRDYDRYKETFHPHVIESKGIRGESSDRFSLILMNKAVLTRTALDTDEQSRFVRVDQRRSYGIAHATRIQEIQHYGQPWEQKLAPDQGSGYIWRLYSVTRLEERDGGVYIEVEAVALSRDIPVAVRLVAEPVVRRVSRNSISLSLRQTQQAVLANRSKSGYSGILALPQ